MTELRKSSSLGARPTATSSPMKREEKVSSPLIHHD
ncbi:hypothetical protein LINPERPRIM_LOCUS39261 [Linum perenne]